MQAVGRAIRLADDKTVGTIVIPVFIGQRRGPRGHPGRLVVQDGLGRGQGAAHARRGTGRTTRLTAAGTGPSRRRSATPAREDSPRPARPHRRRLRAGLHMRLVNSVTAPWLEWFGRLEDHYEPLGSTGAQDPRRPCAREVGPQKQRTLYRRGKVSADRIEMLGNLGDWTWELSDAQFEKFVEELRKILQDKRNLAISRGHSLFSRVDDYGTSTRGRVRRSPPNVSRSWRASD